MLRAFRDEKLMSIDWGRAFVHAYYRQGPRWASFIGPRPWLRKISRIVLWPVVLIAAIALNVGFFASALLSSALIGALVLLWRIGGCRVRAFLLILALAGAAFAGEIRGTVVRGTPLPLPLQAVAVTLDGAGSTVLTDSEGKFRIQGVAAGQHSIVTSAPGFMPKTTQLSLALETSIVDIVIALDPVGVRTFSYFLPHTAEGGGWWTYFCIVNPDIAAADLTITAYDAAGVSLAVSDKATRIGVNSQVRGSPPDLFPSSVIAKAAWYKIDSSVPLAGLEMFGSSSQATIAGFPLPVPDSTLFYLPHIASDSQWWTGISFVSAGFRLSTLRVEAFDASGKPVGENSWPRYLNPGEKSVDVINSYFGSDYPTATQWARVSSDAPISGLELFGTNDLRMMAAVPALSQGAKLFYLPHIAFSGDWWTGVALLNVGSRSASVRITAFSAAGAQIAAARPLSLPIGAKAVGFIESFFDSLPAAAAYVRVDSDTELVSFELVARNTPPLFGGLPALANPSREIIYPLGLSNKDWDTALTLLNASDSQATVTLRAMGPDGTRLFERAITFAPRAQQSGSLKSWFNPMPQDIAWVRASSDGPGLIGFLQLYSLLGGQFTDIPALPAVTLSQSLSTTAVAPSAAAPFSRLASQMKASPLKSGGWRLDWPQSFDAIVDSFIGQAIRRGDVILAVDGHGLTPATDLTDLAAILLLASSVKILLDRPNLGYIQIVIDNPLLGHPRDGTSVVHHRE